MDIFSAQTFNKYNNNISKYNNKYRNYDGRCNIKCNNGERNKVQKEYWNESQTHQKTTTS